MTGVHTTKSATLSKRGLGRGWVTILALTLASSLSGCATLRYYWQAIGGQLEISNKQRPISEWLSANGTEAKLRDRLAAVLQIRDFASSKLYLPDNQSYRTYADLQRPYVLWNVFATPELSNELVQSCFPVAGCVQYRGFFSPTDAQAHAAQLAARQHDTFVGGVPAYSTLGWFTDPVLNTFVHYPEVELARLIFHELAHQVVYVKDDSTFNESFATAVEEEGVSRWLAARDSDQLRADWTLAQERRQQFRDLISRYRARLDALYQSDASVAEKRAQKARVFAEMKAEFADLRHSWGDKSKFDRWLGREPNNALLASIATYTELVPAFQQLLRRNSGDLKLFLAEAKRIGRLPKAQRMAELTPADLIALQKK